MEKLGLLESKAIVDQIGQTTKMNQLKESRTYNVNTMSYEELVALEHS